MAESHDVLLVVDVQNDFAHVVLTQDWHPTAHASFASVHPGRAPFEVVAMPYGRQVLWPDHCVQGTMGAAMVDGLHIPHAQLIIRKGYHAGVDSYSAFNEADRRPTGLASYLRERGLTRCCWACGTARRRRASWMPAANCASAA